MELANLETEAHAGEVVRFTRPDPSLPFQGHLNATRSSFILPPYWHPPRLWHPRPVRPPRLWYPHPVRPQLERLQIPCVSNRDVESRSRTPRRITEFDEPDEVQSEEPTPVEESDIFDA